MICNPAIRSAIYFTLLILMTIVALCPSTASAQNTNSLTLPDGFVNEAYGGFDFAAAVKGEGAAQWSVVPDPVVRKMLPSGLILDPSGNLHGTPNSAGLYRFVVTANVGGNETFRTSVSLRILPGARFDNSVLSAAGVQFQSEPSGAAFSLEPCTPPTSTFVLASSTADEETVALTEDAGPTTMATLNPVTLQILNADQLIQTTLGNGAPGPMSVFRKGDYVIIDLVRWKAIKAVTDKTDKDKRVWALYEFTDRSTGGIGWVPRMNPDDEENFDTRIFGSKRVFVLMLHVQTPRTWDIKYKVKIDLRIPKPIENALMLGQFLGGTGLAEECEPPLTRNIWGGRLMLTRHTASDVIVKLNTVTTGGTGEPVSQSKEDEKRYLNEGRYHWDVSVGMPVKAFKELEFSSEDGIITAKKVDRQNAYGFLNLYPRAVDLHGKSYLTSFHGVLGVPISGKPLDRPLIGLGTGFYTEKFKINFFAGVSFNKVREPRTLAAGEDATESELQSDIQTRRIRKFVFGINFPVKQFIDAVKGSK
jgi:hypothetical protein